MDVPLHVCESRDPKGLYKLARAGKIKGIPKKRKRTCIKVDFDFLFCSIRRVWLIDLIVECNLLT